MRLLMDFGHVVRALRVSREMTQAELAGELGCSQQYVAFIEAGTLLPTRDRADQFAKALRVPRGVLTEGVPVELSARNPFAAADPAIVC